MSNVILTIDMITRMAVAIWRNTNAFMQNIDMQYSDEYARNGAKIGDSLRIRLPNEYTVTDGPAASVQDTAEKSTTLTVSTQRHVDTAFTTEERTLKLDDYAERIMIPKVAFLAANVAQAIMDGNEGGVSNYVSNVDGSGNVIGPTIQTALNARATLVNNSAPSNRRRLIYNQFTGAKITAGLSGLLNPQPELSRQYRQGDMYDALGFRWYEDQTVITHTTGTFSAGGTVAGANQTGQTILVNAITGTLKKGDFITFAGVNMVNRLTHKDTGQLRQFCVTADVATNGTSIPIYPALTPAVNGNPVQYQTVTASPINGAAMALVNKAGEVYRKNLAYVPDAITMGVVDLVIPPNVEAARSAKDGLSMRSVLQYAIGTDQLIERLDVLFGFLYVRPEWCVAMADSVT